MDWVTVIGLAIVLVFIGAFIIYFLRGALDSTDSHRVDKHPGDLEDDSYLNHRDPSHDEKL
ncbi:hypothetical protein JOC78_002533 [Bacillus ectoiniformans]|uniref:hypothetical protein n=1 Tax=Bacillus ectoiniformans TaxID=1494429 RepID=UPI00195E0E68|nr:hypothetical protein [Bacillus ectoiniformans]MBM7649559.1 hypothetical protein [Bacillus ectoiniformans]